MRQHTLDQHPQELENMLDLFKMKCLKLCKTALQRQVREAVVIGHDFSHTLLNSKEEFNRCMLPVLQAVGPPSIKQQILEDKASLCPPLTAAQEEHSLGILRTKAKKRSREARDSIKQASKRLKYFNNVWLFNQEDTLTKESSRKLKDTSILD